MHCHNIRQLLVTSYCIMYNYLKLCPYLTDRTEIKQKLSVLWQILCNIYEPFLKVYGLAFKMFMFPVTL
jgi:hypothetical protein